MALSTNRGQYTRGWDEPNRQLTSRSRRRRRDPGGAGRVSMPLRTVVTARMSCSSSCVMTSRAYASASPRMAAARSSASASSCAAWAWACCVMALSVTIAAARSVASTQKARRLLLGTGQSLLRLLFRRGDDARAVLQRVAGLRELVGEPEPETIDELECLVLIDDHIRAQRHPPRAAHKVLQVVDDVERCQLVTGPFAHRSATSRPNLRLMAVTLTAGAASSTLPPNRHTSLMIDEDTNTLENDVIRNTVFTDGLRRRFINAI